MSQIQPVIGHLLSKYDQTAIEGIDKIIVLAGSNAISNVSKNLRFSDEFLSDPQALEALARFFGRSCDTAIGFRACISLLENATPGNRAAFARYLCRQAFFGPIRKLLNSIAEDHVPSTCGCLSLLTYLMRHYPKLVLAKLNREAPISLGIFKHLTPRTTSLRPYRCLFLAQFALTSFPQINEKSVATHGYLTHLIEDAAELATSKEHALDGAIVGEAIDAAFSALRDAFVLSPHLNKNTKREVVMGQRNVLRALVKWLSDEKYGNDVLTLFQRLVAELHEESFDYFLHRSEDSDAAPTAAVAANNANTNAEFYMPNFSLLAILRLLKPKSYVLHTRLVVFILQKSPDLMRPYFNRVAQHLFEEDRTVSKTNHYAAVVNIICRVACCPIPYHLADPAVAIINTTSEPNTFFTLTPKAIAEEVCPHGLGEFVHRMINKSDNCLHLLMALQVTYAILRRAEEALGCARIILNHNAHKVSAVDAETFLASAEHELKAHLPRTEEFWHRLTQQLLPIAATPKAQYLLQRMYLVVKRYAEVFRLRTPWISAVPPVTLNTPSEDAPNRKLSSISDLMKALANPMQSWDGKSISCLCALLLTNLTMNVPLTKLHHITLGGGSNTSGSEDPLKHHHKVLENSAKEWPALLSLLYWFIAHSADHSGEVVEAKGFIVQLVLWCVHSVSLRFGATAAEIYLWLSSLTVETAPVLLHLLNNMLQQSLSKAADRVAETLMQSQHGVLYASAIPFIARLREKADEKAANGHTANGKDVGLWQQDLQQHLDAFEKITKKVAKRWGTAAEEYHTTIEIPLGEQVALQLSCLSALRGAALHSREVADVDVPISAHIIRYLLKHQAPKPADGALDGTCALPAFVVVPEERGGSQLLTILEQLDNADTAGSMVLINGTFKALCKAAVEAGTDEATEAFLVSIFTTPYAAHTIGRALMDVGQVITNNKKGGSNSQVAEVPKSVAKLCTFVLSALADENGQMAKMTFSGEEQASGFALSIAACASIWLYQAQTSPKDETIRNQMVSAGITIAKNFYGGTLGVLDRCYYAAMLMMELACQGAGTAKAVSFSLQPHALTALRTARYCVGRMATASATAPETDTLGQLVDGWSDAEIQSLALTTPAKMTNTIKLVAPGTVPNILRAMFPDVSHVSEYELTGRTGPRTHASSASDTITTSDAATTITDDSRIIDPRYLLPLLRTNAAMAAAHPGAVPPHWVVRCAPFVIAAMSHTDAAMRREAAIAFALLSNLSGGYVRSVYQYLRFKYAPVNAKESSGGDSSAPLPRVPAPLTNFFVSAVPIIRNVTHPLHNAVVNQFITPLATKDSSSKEGAQIFSNPCPMAHLLTEFPLQCIVGEQVLAKQEESFRQGTTVDSGTTAEAAQSITAKLRAEHPPHIEYILGQLRRSCVTKADAEDLIATNVPSNLFLLAGMLRGAPKTRLRVIKVITEMATASKEVAEVWVSHPNVRIIEWAIFFLVSLGAEAEAEGAETTRHKQCVQEACARLSTMLKNLTFACKGSLPVEIQSQYATLSKQFLSTKVAGSQAIGGPIRETIAIWEAVKH